MDSKLYKIADIIIQVNTPVQYEDKHPYSLFLYSGTQAPDIVYDFVFCASLPKVEGKLLFKDENARIINSDGYVYRFLSHYVPSSDCFCDYACIKETEESANGKYTVYMLESYGENLFNSLVFSVMCIDHSLAQFGAAVLHSAYIEYNSKAILFTAPKQTGKSTQAALWQESKGARIINGDRSIIKMNCGVPYAYGLPYAGTSKICHSESYPIGAVVLLSQAETNRARILKGAEAFKAIYRNLYLNTWSKYDVNAVTDITAELAVSVPVCSLECTPDQKAVDELYALLKDYIG